MRVGCAWTGQEERRRQGGLEAARREREEAERAIEGLYEVMSPAAVESEEEEEEGEEEQRVEEVAAVADAEAEALRRPPFSSPSFFPKASKRSNGRSRQSKAAAGAKTTSSSSSTSAVAGDDCYDGDDFMGPHEGHWWHEPKQALLPHHQEPGRAEEARWLLEEEELQPLPPREGTGQSYDALLARLAAAKRKGQEERGEEEEEEDAEAAAFRRPAFSSPSFFPKGGGGKGKRKGRKKGVQEVEDDGYDGWDGGGGGGHGAHWWHEPKQALAASSGTSSGNQLLEPWMLAEEEGELQPLAPKAGAAGGDDYDAWLGRLAAAKEKGQEQQQQQQRAAAVVEEKEAEAPTEEALQREQLQVCAVRAGGGGEWLDGWIGPVYSEPMSKHAHRRGWRHGRTYSASPGSRLHRAKRVPAPRRGKSRPRRPRQRQRQQQQRWSRPCSGACESGGSGRRR